MLYGSLTGVAEIDRSAGNRRADFSHRVS